MTDTTQLLPTLSYHCFNKDGSQCALSPSTNEVIIYATNGSQDVTKWKKLHTLDEHSGAISGVDWSPVTNLIVTCAHDRNAYVWKYNDDGKGGKWTPTLVILRINRAATCVKWSPAGNKFAVASGAKCVPICHFEEANDWWVSKMIKKHKSTVLSLAWSCNNKFIVTGSADMKCRIFSAFLDGIDNKEDDGFGEVFGPQQHEFGEALAEFDGKAWVHAVAWAPSGFRLAYATHAATVHFVQLLAGSAPYVQTINTRDLPYLDVQFLSDNTLIGAGFESNIDVLQVAGGSEFEPQWKFQDKVDKKDKNAAAAPKAVSSAFGAARGMFAASATQGHQFGEQSKEVVVATKHKNAIINIALLSDASKGLVTKFTTGGIDGRVCYWDVASLGLK